MNKIQNNAPLWLIIALSLKGVALGISGADATLAVSLVGLLTLREYLSKHKLLKEIEEQTSKQIKEMQEAISTQNKVIRAQAEEFEKLRGTMTGIKMAFGQKEQTAPGTTGRFGGVK